jgi:hypothetical protein
MKRMKRRGRREAEGIPSKACFGAAIQSEANTTQSEGTDETDEEKEKEREQSRKRPMKRMKRRASREDDTHVWFAYNGLF